MKLELNKVHCLNALDGFKKLEDESIDSIITSPPYYNQRDYQAGYDCVWNDDWKGQLGLEPTPDLYIKHLCDIFEEGKRALKPTGTVWINIGDTYNGSGGSGSRKYYETKHKYSKSLNNKTYVPRTYDNTIKRKSQIGIPFRLALEMINRGWILRNTIIWEKPSCVPESANDRFSNNYEFLFFFTKEPKYYFEQQFEPYADSTYERSKYNFNKGKSEKYAGRTHTSQKKSAEKILNGERKGRNKRVIWKINTASYKEAHFAIFPKELIETPLIAGTPKYVCKKCGKPQEKIFEKGKTIEKRNPENGKRAKFDKQKGLREGFERKTIIDKGFQATCDCNTGFDPGIVVDPFMGCYDKDTEVLTEDGWKFFKDVTFDDLIYSLNPKTNEIELSPIFQKQKYFYEGKMYRIKGRSIDLLITPNHKIYGKEYHQKKYKLYTMDNFNYATFCKMNQGINNKKSNYKNKKYLEFLGFWLADGCKVRRNEKNKEYRIEFHLKKERKIKYLINILKELKINYKLYNEKNGMKKIRISNKKLYNKLHGNTYTKRIPNFVFKLGPNDINKLLKGFYNGDGCNNIFYSCNKKLIDDLQILLFLSNKSGILIEREPRNSIIDGRFIEGKRKQYELTTHKPKKNGIKLKQHKNVFKEKYKNFVYDVTLVKNHILYVRRNGKPVWSGNSGTTGEVALSNQRNFVGFEINPEYIKLSNKRIFKGNNSLIGLY